MQLESHWFCGCLVSSVKVIVNRVQELFPIVVAASMWGSQWVSRRVEFLCNNESVVAILKSGTLREQSLMSLLRYLSMLAIRHSFSFTASSVRRKANPIADALSRFQLQRFICLAPHADLAPTQIPASLLTALQMS